MELKRVDRLISKSQSWTELYNDLSKNQNYTQKFKGDVFERVTQAYLLTLPEYRSTLNDVWLNDDVPRSILKKLNLPSKDFGVDLVAKTKRGEYWTIQCKFKSTSNALTYKELSTFSSLSFVTAKDISLAVVAHTSTKPIRNRDLLKNMTEIGGGRWMDMTEEEWSNIKMFCKSRPIKLVKRKPRPHQKKAIRESKKYFLKKKRGKLIMPCATGKSLTAFWISQALESKNIIVSVPSLALVRQSLNDWTKEYMAHEIVPEWLCVCSDQTAGKVNIDEFNTDTYDLGIPTTTQKSEIIKFLKRQTKVPKIIFTTYQSSLLLADAAKSAKAKFDFGIFDEAHKTVGVKGKRFSTLIYDEEINIKKRMFMTATERVLRGANDEVASMDDKELYGDFIYVMTFKDAIEQEIISDYKIITMLISSSEVDKFLEENLFLKTDIDDQEHSAQYLASGVALKKAFKKYNIKHAISFHRSIKLAKEFQNQQDLLNEVKSLGPKVQNLHVSSKKSSGERTELIKEFIEMNRALLTNARCLTEGVDVPSIDCVTFIDQKQSTIDIVQAAGRALRKHTAKKFGYILLPIVVPEDVDFETFAETSSFKKITSIIASLSSQDERISEQYRLQHRAGKSSGIVIDIDPKIKIGKQINMEDFSKAINLKIWDKVGKINRRSFSEARDYARSLNFNSREQWLEMAESGKLPRDIVSYPNQTYASKGWLNWGDWLGTGRFQNSLREFRSFEEARKYARSLKLTSNTEWHALASNEKFPYDIPKSPDRAKAYSGQWVSWPDWLGSDAQSPKDRIWRDYEDARKFVVKLKLKTMKDWYSYCKENDVPEDIPVGASNVYKGKGWKGVDDWLGLKGFLSFEEARNYAHSQNISGKNEWMRRSKLKLLPKGCPSNPQLMFKKSGWSGWKDFLGH